MILRKTQEGAFVRVHCRSMVSKPLLSLDGFENNSVKILTWDVREIICCYSIVQAYSPCGIDLTQHLLLTVSSL
jgi:hypothetical protein